MKRHVAVPILMLAVAVLLVACSPRTGAAGTYGCCGPRYAPVVGGAYYGPVTSYYAPVFTSYYAPTTAYYYPARYTTFYRTTFYGGSVPSFYAPTRSAYYPAAPACHACTPACDPCGRAVAQAVVGSGDQCEVPARGRTEPEPTPARDDGPPRTYEREVDPAQPGRTDDTDDFERGTREPESQQPPAQQESPGDSPERFELRRLPPQGIPEDRSPPTLPLDEENSVPAGDPADDASDERKDEGAKDAGGPGQKPDAPRSLEGSDSVALRDLENRVTWRAAPVRTTRTVFHATYTTPQVARGKVEPVDPNAGWTLVSHEERPPRN